MNTHWTPPEPTPLLRETPQGAPYPLDALGPLRDVAEAIHDITQAPHAIGAQSVLGVAALAAQGLVDPETLHGPAPASLFLLTVAQSGERKSAADRLAMAAVRDYEAELATEREALIASHRDRLDIWEAQRKSILATAKNDPEGARAALDALGTEPAGPLLASIVSDAPTLEGVTKNMGGLRASLGIFTDEGGAFIGGHSMSRDHRLKTAAGLSALWGGAPVSRWRAGDGVAVFRGRRLSAHLMAQPVAADELLADPVANGQGLLARFLIAAPLSAIGTRLRTGHDAASDAALASFERRIGTLLRRDLPLAAGSRNELDPPVLPLTAEARELLQAFAHDIERAQAPGGGLEAARPSASKAAEQAARLAAVLAVYAGEDEATGATMAGAIELAAYYVNEALRLADAAIISKETAEAEKLRRWLGENWSEPLISAGIVAQFGPSSLRETKKARAALRQLEEHGWVVAVDGGAEVKGTRRKEAWRIMRGAG